VARIWASFEQPAAVLSLVDELGGTDRISVLVRDPRARSDVVVLGPLIQDMACYPFLDVPHHIRRLGLGRGDAEQYARVLRRGGAVVCVDEGVDGAVELLTNFEAHDVLT
jgi:hypothetical protein